MLNRILMSTKPFVKSHHGTLFNRAIIECTLGFSFCHPYRFGLQNSLNGRQSSLVLKSTVGKFVECNLGICLEKTMTILKKFEGLLKNSSGFRSGLKE